MTVISCFLTTRWLATIPVSVVRASRHQCRFFRPLAALRLQQACDLGIGPRAAEQETLALVAAFAAQAAQFGFGLDTFGRDGDAETHAQADDRTHDRLRIA